MPGDRYGHLTEADPRNVHPVISSERTPLLRSRDAEQQGNGLRYGARGGVRSGIPDGADNDTAQESSQGETTVVVEDMSTTRIALILGTSWIGVFLGAIDTTIITTLSGPIASEFDSLSMLSWLATAYLISCAAFQPISGRLTDIFGRGPGLVLSNLFFAAGNLLCGLSRGPGAMLLGRVIAGIGGGGLMSIATFISSDLVPLRKRGMVQGFGNICFGTGAMVGGILGGFLNDHAKLGWRLAFLIMAPPAILSAALVAVLVRIPPKQSDRSYLSRIDFVGVFLVISSVVLLLFGLNSGGNLVPWMHPLPLATIPVSIVLMATFFWWENRAEQPIIPVKLLAVRTVLAGCLANFFCAMVIMSFLFNFPLYLQVRGDSATAAGLKMLPSTLGSSVTSVGVGYIMKRTGRYMSSIIGSILLLIAGTCILTFQAESSPLWQSLATTSFTGGSYGGILTSTLLACVAAVEHSEQAVVSSALYLYRSVGGTLGITVAAAVYQNLLKAELWKRFGDEPDAAEMIGRIRDSLDELKHLPAGWHDGVMKSFMAAFEGVWLTLLGLAVAGLICSSFMQHHKLHSTLSRE